MRYYIPLKCRQLCNGGWCAQNLISSSNPACDVEQNVVKSVFSFCSTHTTKWCSMVLNHCLIYKERRKNLASSLSHTLELHNTTKWEKSRLIDYWTHQMLNFQKIRKQTKQKKVYSGRENDTTERVAQRSRREGERPSIRHCIHYHPTDLHIALCESNGKGHTYWPKPMKGAFHSLSLFSILNNLSAFFSTRFNFLSLNKVLLNNSLHSHAVPM